MGEAWPSCMSKVRGRLPADCTPVRHVYTGVTGPGTVGLRGHSWSRELVSLVTGKWEVCPATVPSEGVEGMFQKEALSVLLRHRGQALKELPTTTPAPVSVQPQAIWMSGSPGVWSASLKLPPPQGLFRAGNAPSLHQEAGREVGSGARL